MSLRRRKVLVLSVSLLTVAASVIVLGWWAGHARRAGWAGMAFQGALPGERATSLLDTVLDLGGGPGLVNVVAPGSPAHRAGIRVGDRVVAVDGVPLADHEGLRRAAAETSFGSTVEYRVERDGQSLVIPVRLGSPLSSGAAAGFLLSSLLVGMAFLGISLLVAWNRPESRSALVFYFMSVAGAAAFFLWPVWQLEWPGLRGVAPAGFNVVVALLLGVYLVLSQLLVNLLLHLALVFPHERPVLRRWPEAVGWLYAAPFLPVLAALAGAAAVAAERAVDPVGVLAAAGLAAVAALLALVGKVRRRGVLRGVMSAPGAVTCLVAVAAVPPASLVPTASAEVGLLAGILVALVPMAWILLATLAYSVLTCVALQRSYREAGIEEKRQVRWPLWGLLVAVGGSFVGAVAMLLLTWLFPSVRSHGFTLNLVASVAVQLLYLLIPISFAFGILKHRLMDIDLILRKTAVYAGVTGAVLVIYLLLVGVARLALVSWAGVRSQTVTVVATLAVAAVFIPVRNRIQAWVDHRFFLRQRSYGEAREAIARGVVRANRLEDVLPLIAEEVQQAVQSRWVAIAMRQPTSDRMTVAASVGLPDRTVAELVLDVHAVADEDDGRRLVEVSELPEGATRSALQAAGAAGVLPVLSDGVVVSLVAVGTPLGRDGLNDEDEELLLTVGDQLSLAVGELQDDLTLVVAAPRS